MIPGLAEMFLSDKDGEKPESVEGGSSTHLPCGRLIGVVAFYSALLVLTSLYAGGGRVYGSHPVLKAFPLDDSYIHLVYARSLSQRCRFEYNPGVSEAGMSSIVWVVTESPFVLVSRILGFSTVIAVHLLNNIMALLLALACFLFAREAFKSFGAGLVSGAALLFEPSLAFSRFAGMEILLSSAALVFSALFFLKKDRALLCGLFLGVAVLSRLENFVFVGLCLLCSVAGSGKARRVSGLVIPVAAMCGLWGAYNYFVSGSVLPNTFHAKGELFLDLLEAGRIIAHMVFRIPFFALFGGFLFYLAGAFFMWKRFGFRAVPAILFPWLYIVGVASTRPDFTAFWAFTFHRYIQSCIPFLVILWAGGAYVLLEHAYYRLRERSGPGSASMAVLASVIFVSSLWPLPGSLSHWREMLAWNCMNVYEIHVTMGKWIRENTDPDALVAVKDAGAMRYYGERRTLDMLGLNTHQMLDDPLKEVLKYRPDYIVQPYHPGHPPPFSESWHRFMLGGRYEVWLKPVFSAAAQRYTIVEGFPNRQTLYKIAYERPG